MKPTAVTPARLALFLTAIVTVFVVLWPMGIARDYMNHLARTHIEGHLGADPVLQQFFGLSLSAIPDLTMDLIIPWLSQVIGTYAAGGVTIWMGFLLPPLAGIALAKTLHGRVTWLSLLGFLTVFNANMDWGLINYAASSGFALFAFVLWIRMQPGWVRTAVFLLLGLILAVNHAIAFLMFGFLAAAWEVVSYANGERGNRWHFLTRAIVFDLTAMIGGLLYIFVATQGAEDLLRGTSDFFSLEQKAYALSSGAEFYNRPLGLIVSFAAMVLAGLALRNKWCVFAPKMAWICAAFLALVILMPTSVLGIWGLHLRFSSTILILFGASVLPSATVTAPVRNLYVGLLSGLCILCLVNGGYHMARLNQQATSTRSVFANLPLGSKVLPAYSGDTVDYAYAMNAVAMAVIDRSAYVPGLFTNTSPVDIEPDMAALHMPQAQPLTVEELETFAAMPFQPSSNGYWSLGYAYSWPKHWDYVAYFRAPGQAGISGLPLCELAQSPTLILYEIGSCR